MSVFARTREWLARDYAWLALALVLALLVYSHVNRLVSVTTSVPVPLDVVMDKGLAGVVEDVAVATVTLRGASTDINALEANRLRLRLRPRGGEGGRVRVRLEGHMLEGAGRLRVRDITPREVEVLVERESRAIIKVAPPVLLNKPAGRRVEVSHEPKFAEVYGTAAYLDQMARDEVMLRTEPVNLGNHAENFSTNVKIVVPATSAVREVRPGEVRVEVSFWNRATREFPRVPLRLLVPADSEGDWKPGTNTVAVFVTGLPQTLDQMDPGDIYAFVEPSPAAGAATHEAPVQVKTPNEIIIESVRALPPSITLEKVRQRE